MYKVPKLPLPQDLESRKVLKTVAAAHRALAELKGVTGIIPNQSILIDTLALQEAKDSSAIENIITTNDELYQSDYKSKNFATPSAKEVYCYATALRYGYEQVKKDQLLPNSTILEIQSSIIENSAGFRSLPGTELKNDLTGETIYTPPQDKEEVIELMTNLEQYINDPSLQDNDPLTNMAIIHHQFESIHPFYDGNGRTGRIINVLYLVKNDLLDTPILYLSRYINQNKQTYYKLLQAVRRDSSQWETWILFILEAVIQTSYQAIHLIRGIRDLMLHFKSEIRSKLPKIYSQDLVNNLFRHPYTKVEIVTQELNIHRNTAWKYLDHVVEIGLLEKKRIGKESIYINLDLFDLLQNSHHQIP